MISNNVVWSTSKAPDQPAHMRSLIRAFACRLNILWPLIHRPNTTWSLQAQKEAAQAHPSPHLPKCQIVGNHIPLLKYYAIGYIGQKSQKMQKN